MEATYRSSVPRLGNHATPVVICDFSILKKYLRKFPVKFNVFDPFIVHTTVWKNGILNIFHLKSREELNKFHKNLNRVVKRDVLPDENTMKKILENGGFREINIINKPFFNYTVCLKA